MSDKKEITIELNEYSYDCADGCCHNYGLIKTVNGVELDCHNIDVGTTLEDVLIHLGYEVKIKNYFNGEEV